MLMCTKQGTNWDVSNIWHPNNDLTYLESFHWQQFDDVTLAEAEQTLVICHITLQGNDMAWVLESREKDVGQGEVQI